MFAFLRTCLPSPFFYLRPPRFYSNCVSLFSGRSHTCGEINHNDVGKTVNLCGWLHASRNSSRFLLLRDSYGKIQIYVKEKTLRDKVPSEESVIRVYGVVHQRPAKDVNKELLTGSLEVHASDIILLNPAASNIPFKLNDKIKVRHNIANAQPSESFRLRFRYLDLRSEEMQNILRFRSLLLMKMREHLCNVHNVETPYLFRGTPGGASEFLVPSRFPNLFYNLPQSPQQFKQLLMVGGLDRYMQVARCFRDEESRSDRQPEFTQLDIEASFVTRQDIYDFIESMFSFVSPFIVRHNAGNGNIRTPFPRMDYSQAITSYGTDKPDLRFEFIISEEISSFGDGHTIISGFRMTQAESFPLMDEELQQITESISTMTNLKISFFRLDGGDVHIFCEGTSLYVKKALGTIRREFAKLLDKKGYPIYKSGLHFLWIENFPLFEKTEDIFISTHHPFTSPIPDHRELIYDQPEDVIGEHYDLVCNGEEIGGGSIRIHDATLQEYVLKSILKIDPGELGHLLDALKFGAPPHGGIALGLDRLIAIVTGAKSIRDVIAFPKSADGRCLMSGAPTKIKSNCVLPAIGLTSISR